MSAARPETAGARPTKLLDFASAGWLLIPLSVFVLVALLRLVMLTPQLDRRALGDGQTLESYGFTLEPLLVPRADLLPLGRMLPRDALPAMTIDASEEPDAVIAARDLPENHKLDNVRKMTSDTRVIGVALGGEARAYPLWIMNWHELVNDTVGGVPILVSYNGICDSSIVFDRRVSGETLAFRFSGLICNGNLVFYDYRGPPLRPADGEAPGTAGQGSSRTPESLWCQLQLRAIAGPAAAAGARLEVVPFEVTTWADWHKRHPDTTLIRPAPGRERLYKRQAYLTYFADERLRFPAEPLPPLGRRLKTPMLAWRASPADAWSVAEVNALDAATIPPDAARVYAFWFAWNAHWTPDGALRTSR